MKKLFTLLLLIGTSYAFAKDYKSIEDLYNAVSETVVTIEVIEKQPVGNLTKNLMRTTGGLGSGVVINADGSILTAAHVVANAEEIKVHFKNGETVPAKMISVASFADVALIKTIYNPENMKVAELGDSDLMSIGSATAIIGAPYGLEYSISTGIISGRVNRDFISDGYNEVEFLQTDAAINHGNSGGPMFDMAGNVVGIVSHILSESGGFAGIGFAVSINEVKHILLENSPIWSGMSGKFINGELAEIMNIPGGSGYLVEHVVGNSPAGIMGLEGGYVQSEIGGIPFMLGGDIILTINGLRFEPNGKVMEFRQKGLEIAENNIHTIQILRHGKVVKLKGAQTIK
jgi:serine protease Do